MLGGRELSPDALARIRELRYHRGHRRRHAGVDRGSMAGPRRGAAAEEDALMAKNAAKPLRAWRITLIRKKGQYLGRVEAADPEAAIERAIAEFEIEEAHRSRLVAQPVEECRTLAARRRRSPTRAGSGA